MQNSNNGKMAPVPGPFTHESEGFDFKFLVAKVAGNWKWFALSLFLCILFAVIYLLYAIPTFTISARILVNGVNANKVQSGATETDLLQKLGPFSQNADVNNELWELHSRSLMEQAVRDLQMNVSYWAQTETRFAEVYKKSPFFINLLDLKGGLDNPLAWEVRIDGDKVKFMDNYTNDKFTLTWGDTAKLKFCTFVLLQNPEKIVKNPNFPMELKIAPYDPTYYAISESLLTYLSGTNSTSIDVTMDYSVPQKGEDYLNYLISLYTKRKIDANNKVADSTIAFIDERISGVAHELGNVESGIAAYQRNNQITDIVEQGKFLISQNSDASKELAAQEAQIEWVKSLENYLRDQSNNHGTMPTVAPVTDQAYISQVEKYNGLQQQRNQLLVNTTENNPAVKTIDAQLSSIRSNLLSTLGSYREGLEGKKANLQERSSNVASSIQKMPGQQKQILESSRRQDVLQQLYVYLLTVREQTAVTKSNQIAPVRVIDPAKASVYPWWPNKIIVIIAAIFLGLLIPGAVILINELNNNKVLTPHDITAATSVPIIAEISHSKSGRRVVVTKESRTAVAEQFRTLRTDLFFKLSATGKKVIMLTSTVSGEGKSFVTLNLATAMALAGKKVLLIDMELRKAQLSKDLGLTESKGLADYLEKGTPLSEVIQASGINDNLWFLASGNLASNPSETLLNSNMKDLFDDVREKFDFIVLDTPPAAIVTDAMVINRFCDLTLYVVRQRVTFKKHVDVIEEMKYNEKLKNVYVILNDVNQVAGYNSGYGIGFRFDEDFGYYHKEMPTEKRPLLKRIFPEV